MVTGEYQLKQKELFDNLEAKLKKGESSVTLVEPVKDYVNDRRTCLTSVVFIPTELQEKILDKVISPLKEADTRQYYYVPNSFHLTIQNIKTINEPPSFNENDIELAREVFQEVISKFKSINFQIAGIFELPTSLSLRAYSDETLKDLALALRKKLKEAGVPDNKTYASEEVVFGNISISRYTSDPNQAFFEQVEQLKNVEIGVLKAFTVSLITTNSICHPDKTKIIEKFNLQ